MSRATTWGAGARRGGELACAGRGVARCRCRRGGLFAVAVLFVGGCAPSSPSTITLSGSSTVAPVAMELARRFEASHSGVRIDIESGGSARGVSDVRERRVRIGMVSRALRADESDLTGHLLAYDGIGVIVRADNQLSGLSRAQLRAIYIGHTRSWRELGGEDRPIVVVHKAAGRSTHELFLQYLGLNDASVRPSVVIGDNEQGIKSVASLPGAIGYVSIGAAAWAIESGADVRLLPMEGIEPTVERVRDGSWPIRRELNLITRGVAEGGVLDFIAFCQSSAATATIESLGFVAAH